MSRRALVTGASGFLGARLCRRLLDEGWSVIGLARREAPEALAGRLRWISLDLTNAAPKPAELEGLDAVFHLAAETGGSKAQADPAAFFDANERGSFNLFSACLGRVPRLIHASSQVVYGDPGSVAVDEGFPIAVDLGPYAASKAGAEAWLRALATKATAVTILRLAGFVGYGGAIDYFIERARAGKPIELFARGATRRDYLHPDDGVATFIAAAGRPGGPEPRVYNIGSGDVPTSLELARLVCERLGSRSELRLLDVPAPKRDFVYDIARARRELGFAPRGVAAAVAAYLDGLERAHA